MKGQIHNQGQLEDLKVKIEKNVVEDIKKMAEKAKVPVDEIVVVALKRYRARNSDLLAPNKKAE